MKKKITARDNVNLFFSAFLIIAYIVCAYFFVSFTDSLGNATVKSSVLAMILIVFGLLVFYATRVGEGKTVKRFSIVTLIVLDLPTLYIVLASIIPALPLADLISANVPMVYMAGAALGYGIPYTFISGFENVCEEEDEEAQEDKEVLEGGLEADINEAQEETAKAPVYEPETDEIIVEGTAVIDDVDAYVASQSEE